MGDRERTEGNEKGRRWCGRSHCLPTDSTEYEIRNLLSASLMKVQISDQINQWFADTIHIYCGRMQAVLHRGIAQAYERANFVA